MRTLISTSLVLAAALGGTAGADTRTPRLAKITVTSTAFSDQGPIPPEYTCEGANKAPDLSWSGVPDDARSLAILVEDPDAPHGTVTHWLAVNIPTSEKSADAGALPPTAAIAKNEKGKTEYTGPCPPAGTHHYHFRVYALDTTLATPSDRVDFLKKIDGHVLAQGDLVGTYMKHAAK